MSMAKRQQDMKNPGVRKRIEEYLKEDEVAEQLKVTVDGEIIVLVAEGEAGTCEVRLKLDEVERFEEALDKARKRVVRASEHRRSREVLRDEFDLTDMPFEEEAE